MEAFLQFRVQDRVDYRPPKESAWIGASIESIVYNDPIPYFVLITDSFLLQDDGSLTDRSHVTYDEVLYHVAIAGTHVKDDWRESLHHPEANPYIDFWDESRGMYQTGKIVYYCRMSDRVCIVFHRYPGAEMECISLPFRSKKLRCMWDFL